MADSLDRMTVNAFPGVDASTSDHLLQPPKVGAATMRAMLGVDPFKEFGVFQKGLGYSEYLSDYPVEGMTVNLSTTGTEVVAAGATLQGISEYVHNGAKDFYCVVSGKLYKRTGSLPGVTWTRIVSSLLPLDASAPVAFAQAANALFITDGVGKVRVLGWTYSATDESVTWDTEHVVCTLVNTDMKTVPWHDGTDFHADGICSHGMRTYIWDGMRMHASASQQPTRYSVYANDPTEGKADLDAIYKALWFNVGEEDGTPITTALSFENQMLVVGKPNSLHGYVGTDPSSSFSHVLLDGEKGIYAKSSVALGDGKLWFCAQDGPCMLDVKTGTSFVGAAVNSLWALLSDVEKSQVVGWFAHGCYNIVLPIAYPSQSADIPAEARIRLTYHARWKRWAQGWGPHGLTTNVHLDTGTIAVTANGGVIYRQEHSSQLNTVEPVLELVTPWIEFGDQWSKKWVRELWLQCKGGLSDVTFEYAIDGTSTFSPLIIEQPTPSVKWDGSTRWDGTTKWGNSASYSVRLAQSLHCRTLRLRIRGKNLGVSAIGIGFMNEGV